MNERRVWGILSLLIAIAASFVAIASLPGVLLMGMGLVVVLPFAALSVINFRWREEVLGRANPQKRSWLSILVVGFICLVVGFMAFEFTIGLSSIDCGTNCVQSVYDGQRNSRILQIASVTLGVVIWLLQTIYARRLFRQSVGEEAGLEPVQAPIKKAPGILIHLGWSILVGVMVGFGTHLMSSWVVTAMLMSQMPYSESNFEFIQLINILIGATFGLVAFTATLLVRLNKQDQNSSLE